MSIPLLAEKLGIPPHQPDTATRCVRYLSRNLSVGEVLLDKVTGAATELTPTAERELVNWQMALRQLKANHRGHPGALGENGFAREMRSNISHLTVFLAWLEALKVKMA